MLDFVRFTKMLNRIGPSIEPCGTPDSILLKKLDILLIFTLCFRLLSNYGERLLCQNLDHMHAVNLLGDREEYSQTLLINPLKLRR